MEDSYEVHLEQFEGPLDLLLHLVHKAEIDLKDIFVSQITEQYLEYMNQLPTIDLDRASAFLRTASVLLFIKSKSILPGVPEEAVIEDEEDPEQTLMDQLRLYQIYKAAAQELRTREGAGRSFFTKLPEILDEPSPPDITGDGEMLRRAFMQLLKNRKNRGPEPVPKVHVAPERWTIQSQKKRLLMRMQEQRLSTFSALFDEAVTLEEIVVTFAALLELWNAGSVEVIQKKAFSEIDIRYVDKLRTTA